MVLRLLRTMTVGTLLSAIASAAPAQQPGFSAANLPLVMTAYVEAAIDMRAAYETCAPSTRTCSRRSTA